MISNLLSGLIRWALVLGVGGGLVDTTIALRQRATDASRVGLVSLVQLNHHLTAGSGPSLKRHSP